MKRLFFVITYVLICYASFGQKYYNKTESDNKFVSKSDSVNPFLYVYSKAKSDSISYEDNYSRALRALGAKFAGKTIGLIGAGATTFALTDNSAVYMAVLVERTQLIDTVRMVSRTAGNYTADQFNGIALFTQSAGTYTQVSISANLPNIWKATDYSAFEVVLSPAYQATAGQILYVGLFYNSSAQTTAPVLFSGVDNSATFASTVGWGFSNSNRLYGAKTLSDTAPSTIAASALSSSTTSKPVVITIR